MFGSYRRAGAHVTLSHRRPGNRSRRWQHRSR